MKIGEVIKQLRKEQGMQQQVLALLSDVTQTYLSQIEGSKKSPTIEVLEKIARGLNTTLPILFWFSIEIIDIKENKKKAFEILKPVIDSMIKQIN